MPPAAPTVAPVSGPVDDRGRTITLLSLSDLKRAEQDPNKRKAQLARRLRDAIHVESRGTTPTRVLVGLAAVLALIAIRIAVYYLWPAARNLGTPFFWPAIVIIVVTARWWAKKTHASQLARTAVAEGICGSCGYSLEALPVEADGCIQCPECGAVWLAARITRPHWLSDGPDDLYMPPWWQRFFFGVPSAQSQLAPDDRGRYVRILDSRLKFLSPSRRREWGAARFRQVRKELRRVGLIWRLLFAALPTLGAAFMGATAVWHLAQPVPDGTIVAVLAVGCGLALAVAYAIVMTNAFAGPRRLIGPLRESELCACCGRSTEGTQPDSTGCATCPECGAGWRVG